MTLCSSPDPGHHSGKRCVPESQSRLVLTNGHSGTFAPPLSPSILNPHHTNPKTPNPPNLALYCAFAPPRQNAGTYLLPRPGDGATRAGELALVHETDWADCFFYLQRCVSPQLRLCWDCVRLGICLRDVGIPQPPCDCRWLTDAHYSLFDQATDKLWDNMNKGRQWKDIRHRYVDDE